ncbi:MAG: CotH kinase family protein, partial [Anaerohalosphaera sp.]|nr:CotH kinase family protein [Anaerohalosphaera sp.]
FTLSADGEYLALILPNGTTIASEYSPVYPQQFGGISYGLGESGAIVTENTLISEGADASALVPADDSLGQTWAHVGFNDAGWITGTTGVGYENSSGYDPLIGIDVQAMYNNNASVYIRIPFDFQDVITSVDNLTLWMKYDDGFVAYLNGHRIAWANVSDPDAITWESNCGPNDHPDNEATSAVSFDITQYKTYLAQGQNVLAIHGLNVRVGSSDMLILPELTATTSSPVEVDSITKGYMTSPTAGNSNSGLVAPLGPFIRNVTEDPIQPGDSDALVITAEVAETFDPVTGVTLHYRVKYGNEVSVQMYDDGTHGDGPAGDSVYGATIPASASSPGQMLRWYVTADDAQQQTSRNPLYPWPDDSPQYYGTVIKYLSLTTQLPVFWWSTEDVTNSRTRTGARASVFYNGHFYDNIFVRARGGWSAAGSQKFDFNRGFGIYVNETLGRVGEININVKGSDPSYIRPVLGFFIHEIAGNPGSYSFLTHMRLNGNFDRVGIAIEQIDEDYLKRHGLNEFGSLYKFVPRADGSSIPGLWDANSGAEPKLDTADLSELADMTATLRNIYKTADPDTRLSARRTYVFDNINIPEMVNYMAVRAIIEHADDMRKNFYLARDLGASDEWSFMPWDLDWSLGSVTRHLPPPPGQSSTLYTHPFLCDSDHKLSPSPYGPQWNLLYDVVLDTPEFKEMMLRRLRTLMDAYLQPPDTPVSE